MSVRRPRPDVCLGGGLDENLENDRPELSRDGDVKFSVAAHADGARPFDRWIVMAPSSVSRAGHDASGARRRRRASPTERPVTPTPPGEAKLLVEEYDGTELDYVFLGHPRDAVDDALASVERVGVRPRRRAGLGSVARALRAAFLPEGYPDSVTPDYAPFQFWDTCQALCSYVRGSLTTRALLEGVGVGTVGASSASATAQFVLRDMTGMLGGVLFAARVGSGLDENAKQWRFFADCVNDVGMAFELAAPLFGDRAFLLFACLGSLARALCGCAAGATRAALTQHFAARGNAADLAAKEASQETATSLVGMALGLAVTRSTHDSPSAQWAVFLALTALHLWCNVRAVRSVVIRTFNRTRVRAFRKQTTRLENDGDVRRARGRPRGSKASFETALTPEAIATVEPLLPAFFTSDERMDRVRLGVGLSDVSSAAALGAVAKMRSERDPTVSDARRWVSHRDGGFVAVTFAVHAEPRDVLVAYFRALGTVAGEDSESVRPDDDCDAEENVRVENLLRSLGWDVDHSNLHPGPRRVEWRVDELARRE